MNKFQRGISIEGVVAAAFLLAIFSILGMKLMPHYMENKIIQNIFIALANDPEMKQSTIIEIQGAYNKRAGIDNINVINYTDIHIDNTNGSLYLSAEYEVTIPMVSNISLLLEFNPSSE
jgi:hypothetical protein